MNAAESKSRLEPIRAFRACRVGTLTLKANEVAEVASEAANMAVKLGDAGFATRVELLKSIGSHGPGNVEPGIGSIIEVSSWDARELIDSGKAKPARPLGAKAGWPLGGGPSMSIRIAAPEPKGAMPGAFKGGLFVAALGRTCMNGEVHRLPEEIAARYIDAGLAVAV